VESLVWIQAGGDGGLKQAQGAVEEESATTGNQKPWGEQKHRGATEVEYDLKRDAKRGLGDGTAREFLEVKTTQNWKT